MDAVTILTDLAGRPRTALTMAQNRIAPENANIHPCGHDNSIAWLLWHTGREIDVQLAQLAKTEEVWNAAGFRERLSLGDLGDDCSPIQSCCVRPRAAGELKGSGLQW